MGLGSFLSKTVTGQVLDKPIKDITGETGAEAALEAGAVTEQELLRQFNLQQENLRPFLQAAQRQLPGIEQQLSPAGFLTTLEQLTPQISGFLDPVQANKQEAAQQQLQLSGLGSLGGAPATEAGQIDEILLNQLLLGAESDLFNRRLSISGTGQGVGTTLSTLGQRTGQGISQANITANTQAQQAKAQGRSNILNIAALGASFSDERLKENIEEIGEYKGLRIIRWKWRDFVPQSWRDVNFGFSAQNVLNKYPQFVSEKHGFLAIDKDRLLDHLEAI